MELKMGKKNGDVARKAWNILRLALLWGRKGGVFKRRLVMDLRLLPKYIRNLGQSTARRDRIYYGERELSFDKTPIFHRPGSMRFRLPCISTDPQVDFEYEFDDDDGVYSCDGGRKSFLKGGDEEEEEYSCEEIAVPCEEEGIDSRAEEFIANFYAQMKVQRQISYLQHNDMLNS